MADSGPLRSTWDRFAEGYDNAVTPFSMLLAQEALRIAGVGPGMRVLDIAAGGGALSIPAARQGADVLAIDFSSVMVERLKRRVEDEGLDNVQARVMDGTALDLDDDSFDMACSQLGIMLFPNRQQGLQEMARVTKPGGKGLMVVFGPLEQVQFISLFLRAVQQAVPGFAPPQDSPLFSLQNPDDLRRELEDAGFKDVRVETIHRSLEIESAEHLLTFLRSSTPPIAGLLSQFTEAQQAAVRENLDALFRSRFGDGPAQLSAAFNVGVGVK